MNSNETSKDFYPSPQHEALSRRVRGARFARVRYRLASAEPFMARRNENTDLNISEIFAFRRG